MQIVYRAEFERKLTVHNLHGNSMQEETFQTQASLILAFRADRVQSRKVFSVIEMDPLLGGDRM